MLLSNHLVFTGQMLFQSSCHPTNRVEALDETKLVNYNLTLLKQLQYETNLLPHKFT